MKKFFAFVVASFIFTTVMLCGCSSLPFAGTNGRDGVDGKNASVYDYYELAKSVHGENYTVEQFLKDYLSYTSSELEEAFSLQASINRSLRSAVAVAAQFNNGQYTSLGSGVIVDLDTDKGDAYVLTNCHVVYNDAVFSSEQYAKTVYLYLYGQEADYNDADNRFSATVVGASITYDVALLKVTGSDLLKNNTFAVAAEFSSEDDVYLGEQVYTIGNAEGCGISATSGYITKDRESVPLNISDRFQGNSGYTRYYDVIRTDTTINEGNSGGALFNRDGKIVALVNSKSAEDGIEGMGYAIPASAVRRLYPLMRENYENGGSINSFSRAHFVVEDDFTKAQIDYGYAKGRIEVSSSGSSSTWNSEKNLCEIHEKISVIRDSNGLKAGDLITHVKIMNGTNVVDEADVDRLYHLNDTLLSARQGYTVIITVMRGSEEKQVTAQMTYSTFD